MGNKNLTLTLAIALAGVSTWLIIALASEARVIEEARDVSYSQGWEDASTVHAEQMRRIDEHIAQKRVEAYSAGYEAGMTASETDPADIMEALATPCAEEDSIDCYWNAETAGNGTGASFVNIGGNIFPLPY